MYDLQVALIVTALVFLVGGVFGLMAADLERSAALGWASAVALALSIFTFLALAWIPVFA